MSYLHKRQTTPLNPIGIVDDDLKYLNRRRKELGLKEYVLTSRKCLTCDKVFTGIKGVHYLCELHRSKPESD